MPRRKELLVTNEIYHVYNRSVGKQNIFSGSRELSRILELFEYYRLLNPIKYSYYKTFSKDRKKEYMLDIKKNGLLVDVYAYCVMPDHYHLLIKQEKDEGIKEYVRKFQNAYAKYFNKKEENRGSIFINPFKAKRISSDDIFLHVSRYIHLNPATSYIIKLKDLKTDRRTSFSSYIDSNKDSFVNSSMILSLVGSIEKYIKFVSGQKDYQRELKRIEKYTLD